MAGISDIMVTKIVSMVTCKLVTMVQVKCYQPREIRSNQIKGPQMNTDLI